ncbi:hypothetical protein IB279_31840 [Ensifer sp. ENS06]|uniref:hypothetical protein n=1 Tax=Ensifer sp. ENS06 TaxID=2769276 RepID=UPI00177FBCDF|nr:hypothetical protein [Ensifer sp. ENS06]MBD9627551.1 hypothetical protein [Ensifer sp. ENS06]
MFFTKHADLKRTIERHYRSLSRTFLAICATIGLTACEPVNGQPTGDTASISDASVPDFGKWSIYRQIDPMTDKKIVSIQLAAESDGNRMGVLLSIYCSKDNGWATVRWNEFLGGKDYGGLEVKEVTYRLGDTQPVSDEWAVLDDRSTSRITDAPKFIMKVRDTEKLVLRVEPYQELPKTAVFNTKGLKAALTANLPECDWYMRDIQWAEYQAKLKAEADRKAAPSQ